jgi:hypothetical protein
VEINPAESEKKTWFWVAIGTSIFAGIVLLVTLLCISRIKIAVACVKVSRRLIGRPQRAAICCPRLKFCRDDGWAQQSRLHHGAQPPLGQRARPRLTAFSS